MITRVMTPVNGLEVLMPVLGKETTTADVTYMYWQGVDGFEVSFLVMLEDGVWYPLTKEIAESYGITEEELKEHASYIMENLYMINYAGKALRERYPDAMSAEEKKAFADSEEALQKNFDPYREGDLLNLLNLLKRQQGSEEDLSEVDGLKMTDTCKSDLKMYQSNILDAILKDDENLKELPRHMIENLMFSCQEMMLNCRHLLETNDTEIDPIKLTAGTLVAKRLCS